MSSTSALKMPTSVRSVSSSPRPTSCRPVKTVSAPFTVMVSGASAIASSLTVPRSTTRRRPARLADSPGGWRAQNSRNSLRVRSRPVVLSAGHHRAPSRREVPPRLRPARAVVALHDAAGGVGMQRQVEHVLGLLPAARQPDERVDVLRSKLDRSSIAGGDRHQVLPDRAATASAGSKAEKPMSSRPDGLLRRAAELPLAPRAWGPAVRPPTRTPPGTPRPSGSGPAC